MTFLDPGVSRWINSLWLFVAHDFTIVMNTHPLHSSQGLGVLPIKSFQQEFFDHFQLLLGLRRHDASYSTLLRFSYWSRFIVRWRRFDGSFIVFNFYLVLLTFLFFRAWFLISIFAFVFLRQFFKLWLLLSIVKIELECLFLRIWNWFFRWDSFGSCWRNFDLFDLFLLWFNRVFF